MTSFEELNGWGESFESFHARFAGLFSRSEPREQARKYLRALLAPVERKNGWQLAEAIGDCSVDRTQRLLYQANWNADEARDELIRFIIEHFGEEEAIGVVDETGFIKKGTESVGVQRQYTGTAGKVENCQIGTFLSYSTSRGHLLLDRRLYLPESWSRDAERRARAKVPTEVKFETKPRQALAMLASAWEQGVPMRWVTGDEVYGDAPYLRDFIASHDRWYVLAVSCTSPVFSHRPALVTQTTGRGKRMRTRVRLADDEPQAVGVRELVAAFSPDAWKRLSVEDGEKGQRFYDWAHVRVVESVNGLPGRDAWLLVRRSVTDPTELAYYLSNAPAEMPLLSLARVASRRFTVEQCFQEAKGQAGLDQYEVRHYHSWYRHITLSMMAYAFLAWLRAQAGDKKGALKRLRLH